MWNRTFLRLSLIEWLVAVILLLMLGRFFWAREIAALESNAFAAIGLGGGAKYLVTVPLVAWILYRMFARERDEATRRGIRVVRPGVLLGSVGVIVIRRSCRNLLVSLNDRYRPLAALKNHEI